MTVEADAIVRELRKLANAIEDHRVQLELWDEVIDTARSLKQISFGDVMGPRGSHLIVDLNKLSQAHEQAVRASQQSQMSASKPSK